MSVTLPPPTAASATALARWSACPVIGVSGLSRGSVLVSSLPRLDAWFATGLSPLLPSPLAC
jgi:hypothetical protein